jgi:hypothetical protein
VKSLLSHHSARPPTSHSRLPSGTQQNRTLAHRWPATLTVARATRRRHRAIAGSATKAQTARGAKKATRPPKSTSLVSSAVSGCTPKLLLTRSSEDVLYVGSRLAGTQVAAARFPWPNPPCLSPRLLMHHVVSTCADGASGTCPPCYHLRLAWGRPKWETNERLCSHLEMPLP